MNRTDFIRNEKNQKPVIAADGVKVYELFHPRNSGIKNFNLARGLLKAGEKARAHYHLESEEIYYILSGMGKVRLNEQILRIKKHDVVFIPALMIHGLINTHPSRPLVILAIESPPYADGDTVFVKHKMNNLI